MEPALTNIGIVLPEAGYLAAVRELTRQARLRAHQ
jgi:glutamate-1-semialdehyde 2,1-aminomutase